MRQNLTVIAAFAICTPAFSQTGAAAKCPAITDAAALADLPRDLAMKHVPLLALRLLCMCLLGVLGSCGSSDTDGVELETVVSIEEGSNVSYRLAAGTKYASITSDRNGVTIAWPCGLAVETRSYGANCYFPQDDVLRIYNPVNEVSGGPETVRVVVIRK